MKEAFIREISLIGEQNFEKLQKAKVAVFGIGGVGSYTAEALVRSGIGNLDFIDGDVVAESNLNRQLIALNSTIGKNKAEVMAQRAKDISSGSPITVARDNDKKFYTNYFSAEMTAIDGDKLLISQEYLMISENERLRQICQSLSF